MTAHRINLALMIVLALSFQGSLYSVAIALNNAESDGLWAFRKHNYKAAKESFDAALNHDVDLSKNQERRAFVLYQLGLTEAKLGANSQAEQHLLQSLALREKVLRPTHPDIVQTCRALESTCEQSGNYKTGADCYRKEFDALRTLFGADSQIALDCLENLTQYCQKHSLWEQWGESLKLKLALQEMRWGNDPTKEQLFQMSVTRELLADSYKATGNLAEQENQLRAVLKLRQSVLGSDRFEGGDGIIAAPLLNLGIIRIKQHKLSDAETFIRRSVEMVVKLGDPNRATVYLNEAAQNCVASGQAAGAEPYLKQLDALKGKSGAK
jgi:tetratricopeptide (TPR) repeat protein